MSSPGLTGQSSIPETPLLEPTSRGVLDRPLSRAMTTGDMTPHSRGMMCPRVAWTFALVKGRGRREDRVHAAPAVSCASCTKENAHEHTGSAETLRPSPRNGFTAYFVLSPVTGFVATVVARISPRNLTPASGRQDHTTSPSASASFVRALCVALRSHCAPDAAASTASRALRS